MERLREDLEALRGMQRDGLVSTHEAAQVRRRSTAAQSTVCARARERTLLCV